MRMGTNTMFRASFRRCGGLPQREEAHSSGGPRALRRLAIVSLLLAVSSVEGTTPISSEELGFGPETCRRLSGIGGAILGGFVDGAFEVETDRFENGVRVLNDGAEYSAPMREYNIRHIRSGTIVLPDTKGHHEYGDIWGWWSPNLATRIYISLPEPLLAGDGEPREALTTRERETLVEWIAESLAVLPQAILASLPPRVWMTVMSDLDSGGERIAAQAAYPAHHRQHKRYAVLLNMHRGYGVPVQNGYFGSSPYRELGFEELLIHEFAHLIDDYHQITEGIYWVDGAGSNDGWRPNPRARWWASRQQERGETTQEFVSGYAAINVAENFAETMWRGQP